MPCRDRQDPESALQPKKSALEERRECRPLQVSLIFGPGQNALLPHIKQANRHEAQVHQHLVEPEHPVAIRKPWQPPEDHCPGKHENRLHIEQDEQHRYHVEPDRKPPARIAHRIHAALIRSQLGTRISVLADKEGRTHHTGRQPQRCQYLQGKRKVVPDVWVTRHRPSLTLEVPRSSVKQTAQLHTTQVTAITMMKPSAKGAQHTSLGRRPKSAAHLRSEG